LRFGASIFQGHIIASYPSHKEYCLISFGSLGLCDKLLKSIASQGYTSPSPIQAQAIPAVLSQQDVMAAAHTGTGKTAGFTLPMLQLLSEGSDRQPQCVRGLILAPTRELAAQVAQSVKNYSQHLEISCAAVFGGVRIEPQIAQLQFGVDVLVATPGRLLDLYQQQAINFDALEILVLDEADRMLDLGFIDDIHAIQKLLPVKRQTLMFSATFSKAIKSLAQGMLNHPIMIEVTVPNSVVDTVKQRLHPVDKARKSELLIHLIKANKWRQVLVFSRTKQGADHLVGEIESAGIRAASIHGDRTQHARTRALEAFKAGQVGVLVATDIASRGIDVQQLPCVVNFDLPYAPEDYVHRIGRTGRAGTSGLAVSFFSEDESKQLSAIERLIGRSFEGDVIPGFAPRAKAMPSASDDDDYGNFEPDPEPSRRGKIRGRAGRGANSSHRRGGS
jgi:ATP-dependent RNA helicase RhlE